MKGREHETLCIYTTVSLLCQEFALDLRVCLGRKGRHLARLQAYALEELSNLAGLALNTRQLFNLRCRVGARRWRILQKKFFKVSWCWESSL